MSRRNFLLQILLIPTLLSIVTAIYVNIIWTRSFDQFRTIYIPVFIRGQDAQGGQFALGVVRAMQHAELHRLSEVEGRRIEPVFIDEDPARTDDVELRKLRDRIKGLNAPVVVGPLTSSAAKRIVPVVAGDLKIPMILGIPTSTTALAGSGGRAWRLSPTNDQQAQGVMNHYRRIRKPNDRLLIIQDKSDNADYSDDLMRFLDIEIKNMWSGSGNTLPDRELISNLADYAKIDPYFNGTKTAPTTIIYVGMAEVAKTLVSNAAAAKPPIIANWIFTDGCITDRELVQNARAATTAHAGNRFFVTFQGPPPADKPGLARYIWFVRNTGGDVSFVLENSKCNENLAASSYEIFGFDSYLTAVKVVNEAARKPRGWLNWWRPKVSSDRAFEVLNTNRISDPFLLLGDYNFANGNSQGLTFHVYEIAEGCLSRWSPPSSL
ncbi:MAG: ABC transporter substrate-binding protein [Acidobacteriota bacterium]|nr:ABC transporter substrate-binding protein [Acidobacteriota bacterium]